MALIQSVLLSRVNIWGARPDLMFLVVLSWAIVRGVDEGLVWGFIGGLIVDLLSGGPLGVSMLALLVVVVLVGQPWGRGVGSSVVRLLLLVFFCVIVYHLVMLIILAWTGHTVGWTWAVSRVALPSALLNASLSPFVQRPMSWLERRTRRETLLL